MVPYDRDAINQFLGNPMILEEGQQCKYTSRRERATGFDEEAIVGNVLKLRTKHRELN